MALNGARLVAFQKIVQSQQSPTIIQKFLTKLFLLHNF